MILAVTSQDVFILMSMLAAVGPVLIYWQPPSGADTRTAS